MGGVGVNCSQVVEPGLHQIVGGGWEGDGWAVRGKGWERVRGRVLCVGALVW